MSITKKFFSLIFAVSLIAPVSVPTVRAGGCFEDPIYDRSGQVKVIIGARVRDLACMEGSTVLKTLPVGRVVQLIGETDGWLKIRDADGVEGWVGAQLLMTTDEAASPLVVAPTPKIISKPAEVAPTKSAGEIWVKTTRGVNMRAAPNTRGKILKKLKGGMTLDLLEKGKGWYKVKDQFGSIGWVYSIYLRSVKTPPPQASPLSTLPTLFAAPATPTLPVTPPAPSKFQQGTVPSGIDVMELNRYWLTKVNALRAEKGLRVLVLDQRWIDTASEYAAYMGINHATGHERADGTTMHQWIDGKGLQFTTRYSENGWRTNYFTENISWNQIEATTEDAKRALDDTMSFYLGEASYNGAHYRTTYHADWNSVGAGFYFEDLGNGRVKFYQVFHYGSLVLPNA